MKTAPLLLSLAAISNIACAAAAGEISQKDAQSRVASAERDNVALIAHYPALQAVENVVKDDCAAKSTGEASSGGFCECAAAVTMELWRSGIDPKMLTRLTNYVKNPDESAATDFLKYQGPELYRPLCEQASGH
jgi:hypothetical protein